MSLHPQSMSAVPEETARVARAAFPCGNVYMRLRDELGAIFTDIAFAPLFSQRGQPAESPGRLALITLMQYAEGLSDRQAADAVRGRIDWKYALGLELTDSGFDSSVLSEFRSRLVRGSAEQQLFDSLLDQCRQQKLLTAGGKQRTDSTHVLAAIRALNRLECVGETLRHALNSLAVATPDWLLAHSHPEWVDRYGPRVDDYRLPKGDKERQAYAQLIGEDGQALLASLYAEDAPQWLRQVPAVETLRRVWVQQYCRIDDQLCWRTAVEGLPPSVLFINSPYDRQAHYARKSSTSWVGYKVHLTESCDEGQPHLITHVETTAAPVADGAVTPKIHRALEAKDLLPSVHLADTGYLDAELLASSRQQFGIDLLGPTRPDIHWQAQAAQGFEASRFRIDWQRQQAICPQEHTSISWTPAIDNRHNPVIKIKFSSSDCGACLHRTQCTQSARGRRSLTIRPQDQYLALEQARQREASADFKEQYAQRAGIEGTLSQAVRAFALRRARYVGQAKTHLQHVLTATAINWVRVGLWLAGHPHAQTRKSSFVALLAQTTAAI